MVYCSTSLSFGFVPVLVSVQYIQSVRGLLAKEVKTPLITIAESSWNTTPGATQRERGRFKGWVKANADWVTFFLSRSLNSASRHLTASAGWCLLNFFSENTSQFRCWVIFTSPRVLEHVNINFVNARNTRGGTEEFREGLFFTAFLKTKEYSLQIKVLLFASSFQSGI